MSNAQFEFKMKPGMDPTSLIVSHLLRVTESQIRIESMLHLLLSERMSEGELESYLEMVDIGAEKLKYDILADIVSKYGA